MANPSDTAPRKEKLLEGCFPSHQPLMGIFFFVWREDARTEEAVQGGKASNVLMNV
jgi:hypothetical protein